LKPLLDDVLRQQSELAAGRGVRLSLKAPDESISFAFDPDLLRVALLNLVQNAIQASPSGGNVEVRAEPSAGQVQLFVSDHGEGIQPQHLESIFNPFFTTKPEGVGLGLALVSKIADEHHGRIRVYSQPGVGTTFEMTLPKEQPA
jgi:signal transduction histidine kinase